MRRILLKSKIHNATVTQSNLYYEGSITIDSDLLEEADMIANERVQVVNIDNGERFETYIILGEAGTGIIGLNGPAARLGMKGDKIHILTYTTISDDELDSFHPRVIILDENNKIKSRK
jgi:aspartate 1-decarboxylase